MVSRRRGGPPAHRPSGRGPGCGVRQMARSDHRTQPGAPSCGWSEDTHVGCSLETSRLPGGKLLRKNCLVSWAVARSPSHDVVTAIGSLVPITSMKASSLSFSIAPRPAFIEVETTVGPARARGRPRMRAVPYSDLCVSSRRSRGYEKPKRAFTGPLGSTQHRELRPAHRKRPSHRETKRASNGM